MNKIFNDLDVIPISCDRVVTSEKHAELCLVDFEELGIAHASIIEISET